jgi:hypothetical protein
MLKEIREATRKAEKAFKKSKTTIQFKSLINQLTNEIETCISEGDWNFAVRLSHYRHEFAKTHQNLDWYPPYLEIRKARDLIDLLMDKR